MTTAKTTPRKGILAQQIGNDLHTIITLVLGLVVTIAFLTGLLKMWTGTPLINPSRTDKTNAYQISSEHQHEFLSRMDFYNHYCDSKHMQTTTTCDVLYSWVMEASKKPNFPFQDPQTRQAEAQQLQQQMMFNEFMQQQAQQQAQQGQQGQQLDTTQPQFTEQMLQEQIQQEEQAHEHVPAAGSN